MACCLRAVTPGLGRVVVVRNLKIRVYGLHIRNESCIIEAFRQYGSG
jgi:hypothetical protein